MFSSPSILQPQDVRNHWGIRGGRYGHCLGDHLTGRRSDCVKVGIPQLELSLALEPPGTHQQAKDDAGAVLLATGLLGSLDDFGRDDAAVSLCNERFLELAGDAVFDEVA